MHTSAEDETVWTNRHLVWSNRSAANLKLGLAHFAAADALECIRLNPSFLKGHLRLADAYVALGSIKEAITCLATAAQAGCDPDECEKRQKEIADPAAIQKAITQKQDMGFSDPSFMHKAIFSYAPYGGLRMRPDRTVASNTTYFAQLTEGKDLEIRDTSYGRAVFATRAYKKGDLIFSEAPLVTATTDKTLCSFCTLAVPKNKSVCCDKCACERYCSTHCRDAALHSYHQHLCMQSTEVEALMQGLQGTELAETGKNSQKSTLQSFDIVNLVKFSHFIYNEFTVKLVHLQ